MKNLQSFPWIRLTLGFLVVLSVFLLATSLDQLKLHPGKVISQEELLQIEPLSPIMADETPDWMEHLVQAALLIFFLLFLLSLFFLVTSRESRRRTFRPLAVILLIFLTLFFFRVRDSSEPIEIESGEVSQVTSAPSSVGTTVEAETVKPPEWAFNSLSILLVAVVAFLLWRILLRLGEPLALMDQIAEEAQQAITAIDAGEDFHNVIIRCYIEMCEILKVHFGMARDASMTPREFQEGLLSAGLHALPVSELTYLFEKTRYGNKPIRSDDEDKAVKYLAAFAGANER